LINLAYIERLLTLVEGEAHLLASGPSMTETSPFCKGSAPPVDKRRRDARVYLLYMLAPYQIHNNDLILDNPNKRYVLRVRDLAPAEKPRERLIKSGPGALSVAELLAIILGTGTVKEEVLAMASRIIKEYGEKSILSRTDVAALAKELDIPALKAAQIVAAGELGRRFYKRASTGSAIIRTAEDVYSYVGDMRSLPKEHLRGLYLNAHFQVIHDEVISIGTLDANLVHPREVFKPALAYSAAGIILVHNHPSGLSTPSSLDFEVTRQVAEAGRLLGIDLIDHVIVTESGYTSIPVE
jgi:DNA repair protein RadC